ncbi:MAG: hypothetical protein H6737_30805 [Alphaproteobacteria bacterium]|nr:hypothetical protein [Alphaproteobacteria bacterium]
MILLTSLAFAGVPTHSAMEGASWNHLSDRNHDDAGTVKVFNATVSDVSCFKAVAETGDADGKTMLDVVVDVVGSKKWSSAGVTQAEVLGRSGNTITYMQYLDVPGWTMSSDRFWFLTSEITDGAGTRSLKWNRIDPSGPYAQRYKDFAAANPNAVEPPINVGGWYFRDNGGTVEITYLICTDAGGSIPYAIQNAATKKTLPDTVGDVVREAKRRLGKE